MSGFETVGSRQVYEGVMTSVRIDTVRAPDGVEFEREIAEHIDAVAVVALTPQGEVLLLEQYRHPFGTALLEIPAGVCDVPGEPPERTAARELAEETGHAADDYEPLGTIRNSAGWSDESTTIFLARGARPTSAPDGFVAEHEEASMTLLRTPLADAVAAVRRGEVTDAKTVAGLLLADGRA